MAGLDIQRNLVFFGSSGCFYPTDREVIMDGTKPTTLRCLRCSWELWIAEFSLVMLWNV